MPDWTFGAVTAGHVIQMARGADLLAATENTQMPIGEPLLNASGGRMMLVNERADLAVVGPIEGDVTHIAGREQFVRDPTDADINQRVWVYVHRDFAPVAAYVGGIDVRASFFRADGRRASREQVRRSGHMRKRSSSLTAFDLSFRGQIEGKLERIVNDALSKGRVLVVSTDREAADLAITDAKVKPDVIKVVDRAGARRQTNDGTRWLHLSRKRRASGTTPPTTPFRALSRTGLAGPARHVSTSSALPSG